MKTRYKALFTIALFSLKYEIESFEYWQNPYNNLSILGFKDVIIVMAFKQMLKFCFVRATNAIAKTVKCGTN